MERDLKVPNQVAGRRQLGAKEVFALWSPARPINRPTQGRRGRRDDDDMTRRRDCAAKTMYDRRLS